MVTKNKKTTDFANLSIRDRIKAMNQTIDRVDALSPNVSTEDDETTGGGDEASIHSSPPAADLPKRSSVVDIWRKRESSSGSTPPTTKQAPPKRNPRFATKFQQQSQTPQEEEEDEEEPPTPKPVVAKKPSVAQLFLAQRGGGGGVAQQQQQQEDAVPNDAEPPSSHHHYPARSSPRFQNYPLKPVVVTKPPPSDHHGRPSTPSSTSNNNNNMTVGSVSPSWSQASLRTTPRIASWQSPPSAAEPTKKALWMTSSSPSLKPVATKPDDFEQEDKSPDKLVRGNSATRWNNKSPTAAWQSPSLKKVNTKPADFQPQQLQAVDLDHPQDSSSSSLPPRDTKETDGLSSSGRSLLSQRSLQRSLPRSGSNRSLMQQPPGNTPPPQSSLQRADSSKSLQASSSSTKWGKRSSKLRDAASWMSSSSPKANPDEGRNPANEESETLASPPPQLQQQDETTTITTEEQESPAPSSSSSRWQRSPAMESKAQSYKPAWMTASLRKVSTKPVDFDDDEEEETEAPDTVAAAAADTEAPPRSMTSRVAAQLQDGPRVSTRKPGSSWISPRSAETPRSVEPKELETDAPQDTPRANASPTFLRFNANDEASAKEVPVTRGISAGFHAHALSSRPRRNPALQSPPSDPRPPRPREDTLQQQQQAVSPLTVGSATHTPEWKRVTLRKIRTSSPKNEENKSIASEPPPPRPSTSSSDTRNAPSSSVSVTSQESRKKFGARWKARSSPKRSKKKKFTIDMSSKEEVDEKTIEEEKEETATPPTPTSSTTPSVMQMWRNRARAIQQQQPKLVSPPHIAKVTATAEKDDEEEEKKKKEQPRRADPFQPFDGSGEVETDKIAFGYQQSPDWTTSEGLGTPATSEVEWPTGDADEMAPVSPAHSANSLMKKQDKARTPKNADVWKRQQQREEEEEAGSAEMRFVESFEQVAHKLSADDGSGTSIPHSSSGNSYVKLKVARQIQELEEKEKREAAQNAAHNNNNSSSSSDAAKSSYPRAPRTRSPMIELARKYRSSAPTLTRKPVAKTPEQKADMDIPTTEAVHSPTQDEEEEEPGRIIIKQKQEVASPTRMRLSRSEGKKRVQQHRLRMKQSRGSDAESDFLSLPLDEPKIMIPSDSFSIDAYGAVVDKPVASKPTTPSGHSQSPFSSPQHSTGPSPSENGAFSPYDPRSRDSDMSASSSMVAQDPNLPMVYTDSLNGGISAGQRRDRVALSPKKDPVISPRPRARNRYQHKKNLAARKSQSNYAGSDAGQSELSFFSNNSSTLSPRSAVSGNSVSSASSALVGRATRALQRRRDKSANNEPTSQAAKDLTRRMLKNDDGRAARGSLGKKRVVREHGLANRYNMSDRFMDTPTTNAAIAANSVPHRQFSFGSETTEESSTMMRTRSVEDSPSEGSEQSKRHRLVPSRTESTEQPGHDPVVNDTFVQTSANQISALQTAYRSVSLHQLANDIKDEVTTSMTSMASGIQQWTAANSLSPTRGTTARTHKKRSSSSSTHHNDVEDEHEEAVAIEVEYIGTEEEESAEVQSSGEDMDGSTTATTTKRKEMAMKLASAPSTSPAGQSSYESVSSSNVAYS